MKLSSQQKAIGTIIGIVLLSSVIPLAIVFASEYFLYAMIAVSLAVMLYGLYGLLVDYYDGQERLDEYFKRETPDGT